QQFHVLNVFSYPLEIFKLEGPVFFLSCLLGFYFVLKRDWLKVLPLAIVCAQIGIFTLASEKGARYLCVVLPFMAMTAAVVLWTLISHKDKMKVWTPPVLLLIFFSALIGKSLSIVSTPQGYKNAVEYIQQRDPDAKILTSQPLLVSLFSKDSQHVSSAPKSFEELLMRYSQGYRYLILDPQAFVSWTQSQARFTVPLVDYLGFVSERVPPVAQFAQLTPALLERFVWDHNEDLTASLHFLEPNKKDMGAVYVYDLTVTVGFMKTVIEKLSVQQGKI
ncbi:MAG: hypothetical protein JNN05_04950, partial [Candidatus Omnitrophica bacterium]|nr:hypothetical protein [Candidatus Omnitrophota bacterium]